jgi:hypothetical protein
MFKPKELDPDHRVTGISPECAWVIEHQHNHQRDQLAEQVRTITQLRPVDVAIPGCTAMNQLVAQGVNAVKHHPQHLRRIAVGQRHLGTALAAKQALFPLHFSDLTVLEVPETLEYVGVIQQRTDTAGELRLHQLFDQVPGVQRAELLQKNLERLLLGQPILLIYIRGIGRVKGNP